MRQAAARPTDLREGCVREALAIIEAEGPERLSLREVARRLGVSHQAPYRHFPSRDHLLAEIIARGFEAFARHLDARPESADPGADLRAMGEAYLDFARAHPLQYRLIFGAVLPDPARHPEMMRKARHAFALLTEAIDRLSGPAGAARPVALDALFVWSAMHGLATITQSGALASLDLPAELHAGTVAHVLERIGRALGKPG
jgi:AcrR family transcriptional regulator